MIKNINIKRGRHCNIPKLSFYCDDDIIEDLKSIYNSQRFYKYSDLPTKYIEEVLDVYHDGLHTCITN